MSSLAKIKCELSFSQENAQQLLYAAKLIIEQGKAKDLEDIMQKLANGEKIEFMAEADLSNWKGWVGSS